MVAPESEAGRRSPRNLPPGTHEPSPVFRSKTFSAIGICTNAWWMVALPGEFSEAYGKQGVGQKHNLQGGETNFWGVSPLSQKELQCLQPVPRVDGGGRSVVVNFT